MFILITNETCLTIKLKVFTSGVALRECQTKQALSAISVSSINAERTDFVSESLDK